MKPHAKHAKQRAVVVVSQPDGRTITGRLAYWPVVREGHVKAPPGVKTPGRKARIVLPSGRYLSVDPEVVELAEETK